MVFQILKKVDLAWSLNEVDRGQLEDMGGAHLVDLFQDTLVHSQPNQLVGPSLVS